MRSTGDQLVEEYLHRFDNASVFLTEERRAELRQEIIEHLNAGVEREEAAYAEAVRAALDRLGPPADIVASETGPESSVPSPALVKDPAYVREGEVARHSGEFAHHGRQLPDGGPASASPPPVPPGRRWKAAPFLIGGVVTAAAIGVLAFGVNVSTSGPAPTVEERSPSTAPPEPGATDGDGRSRPPESGPGESARP